MSKAGKFIPGGGSKGGGDGAPGSKHTAPIRAPEPGDPVPEPGPAKKTPARGSSLIKPVSKNQRLPITLMSAGVFILLITVTIYFYAVAPANREVAALQKEVADANAAKQKAQDDLLAQQQAQTKEKAALHATLIVDTKPTGAAVTIGDVQKQTPATFDSLDPGTVTMTIRADGYEDYKQDVAVAVDKPSNLGVIELTLKSGNLSLTSAQAGVAYSLTGPGDYSHQGQVPDKLEKLPVGDYQLLASQGDWKLAPETITIHDQDNVQKEIKFPYASVTLTSEPAGATVREGHTILGKTPLSLANLHPGTMNLSLDLPPYTLARVALTVPDFGNITRDVPLQHDKDFIAACGMPMVWISDGGFWAGKYLMTQSDFEKVAGYNPSYFRRPDRPVEQVSWESAMAFCDKLTEYERKAGQLPQGYHYTLPTESQWSAFSADADLDQAAMSRATSLTSTQDVGASEPNKYGLYDTLGNVWEWCLDNYDASGDHSLRGGSWLSSADNFPGTDTRNGGAPKYIDRFTGFRVVLVPQ